MLAVVGLLQPAMGDPVRPEAVQAEALQEIRLANLKGAAGAQGIPQRSVAQDAAHLTLVMVGDTGFAPNRTKPLPDRVYKYGRKLSFADTTRLIADEINGDFNFANIETVISKNGKLRPVAKKFNFVTHPNGFRHLVDIGFNMFSMANNHSFDYGQQGIRDSLSHLQPLASAGQIVHAGIGNNRGEAARTPVALKNDMTVALGAIGIGGAGIKRAGDNRPGQLSLHSQSDQSLLAENLRGASAEIRLLSIHLGKERRIRPAAHEVAFLRSLTERADADVMIGHHAHVARGLEMRNGRLIVYGLGNFNHQGTANMNGKSGCQNYSLIVRVHFTRLPGEEPAIAAVEVLPIESTHMQPRRIEGVAGARRIAILNGLAQQFDHPATGSYGIRLMAQSDGSGLYCTQAAEANAETRQLCKSYSTTHLASARDYSRAVATCGRAAPTVMIAKADPDRMQITGRPDIVAGSTPSGRADDGQPGKTTKLLASAEAVPDEHQTGAALTVPYVLERNPSHWPVGMPLAWIVPENETATQKHDRWRKKRYSVAEVETLLRKRGLIE